MLQKLQKRNSGGFTLVEIMIVVAIIALLAAIAVPSFLRARKRSQATTVLNELRMIDAAIDQYAIETNQSDGDTVTWADVQMYLKDGSKLHGSGGEEVVRRDLTCVRETSKGGRWEAGGVRGWPSRGQ